MQLLEQDGLRARQLRMPRTILALMLREMATSYGRSPGGYLWSIIDPVAAVALLSVIFSAMFSQPAIGVNFPLFYATGYLPFMLFNDVANKMATSIRYSRPLLDYPSVTYIDALTARFLLNVLTHLMVGYLVFSGILLVFETRAIVNLPAILHSVALAAVLGIGIGTLNCYLMTAFPVWERAWQILTRPLFLISGIFFIFDHLPPEGQTILSWNPIIHVIGLMRKGFYPTYDAWYVSTSYVLVVGLSSFVLGLMLLRRDHRRLLES